MYVLIRYTHRHRVRIPVGGGDRLTSGTGISIPLLADPCPVPGSTDGAGTTTTSGFQNEGT